MTCERALELMLDAEPDEMSRSGGLAMHIAGCARCSAVAVTIQEETARLARALATASVRPAKTARREFWIRTAPPVALLAASVVVMLLMRNANNAPAPAGSAAAVAQAAPSPAAVATAPLQETPPSGVHAQSSTGDRTRLVRDTPRRIEVAAIPVAVPVHVAPVTAELVPAPSNAENTNTELQVTLDPATRATIMRAPGAHVTVVWIHSE